MEPAQPAQPAQPDTAAQSDTAARPDTAVQSDSTGTTEAPDQPEQAAAVVPSLRPSEVPSEPAAGQASEAEPENVREPIPQPLLRIQQAALDAGMPLDAFVDELLRDRIVQEEVDANAALMTEVKGLFEQLATNIPSQLARGMEAAFRDMMPRLVTPAQPTAAMSAQPAAAPRPPVAAQIELVKKDTGPREVESYRSRRRKGKRVKL
jgi:hypothetical protein